MIAVWNVGTALVSLVWSRACHALSHQRRSKRSGWKQSKNHVTIMWQSRDNHHRVTWCRTCSNVFSKEWTCCTALRTTTTRKWRASCTKHSTHFRSTPPIATNERRSTSPPKRTIWTSSNASLTTKRKSTGRTRLGKRLWRHKYLVVDCILGFVAGWSNCFTLGSVERSSRSSAEAVAVRSRDRRSRYCEFTLWRHRAGVTSRCCVLGGQGRAASGGGNGSCVGCGSAAASERWRQRRHNGNSSPLSS